MQNMNWNYPTNVWFGVDRSKEIQKACNIDNGFLKIDTNLFLFIFPNSKIGIFTPEYNILIN